MPAWLRHDGFIVWMEERPVGRFNASAIVGLVWMLVSPTLAFGLVATFMLTARPALLLDGSRGRPADV